MLAKKHKINWNEADVSYLTMSPEESLYYLTHLAEKERHNDCPWSAFIEPASEAMDSFNISFSTGALHKFTDEMVKSFEKLSKSILKNHSDYGYVAEQSFLEITVPKAILEQTKLSICDLFNTVQHIVESDDWQSD